MKHGLAYGCQRPHYFHRVALDYEYEAVIWFWRLNTGILAIPHRQFRRFPAFSSTEKPIVVMAFIFENRRVAMAKGKSELPDGEDARPRFKKPDRRSVTIKTTRRYGRAFIWIADQLALPLNETFEQLVLEALARHGVDFDGPAFDPKVV